jgi:hypothetical protein
VHDADERPRVFRERRSARDLKSETAMHRAGLVTALVSALSASATGCAHDHEQRWRHVTLEDGGYALVEVVVPAKHEAVVRFSFEGAGPNESFAVFAERAEEPFHIGWFDLSPWIESCERDPTTSPCLDVHSQKAGAFVGVARKELRAPEVTTSFECTGKVGCRYYYAIVAGERGPDRNVRVIVETMHNLDADGAVIEQVR